MIKISSSDGGEFDAHLALPKTISSDAKLPAIIAVGDVLGLQDDFMTLCDQFADEGYIVIAPDSFWRTDHPGAAELSDEGIKLALARAQPRQDRVEAGVQDIADIGAYIKAMPQSNGKIAVLGFCYGGPYAIIGATRLGFDAGISFHGSAMPLWLDEFKDVDVPISLHWGKNDHLVPHSDLELFQKAADSNSNISLHIYDDAPHGYSVPGRKVHAPKAWKHSYETALEILAKLK